MKLKELYLLFGGLFRAEFHFMETIGSSFSHFFCFVFILLDDDVVIVQVLIIILFCIVF